MHLKPVLMAWLLAGITLCFSSETENPPEQKIAITRDSLVRDVPDTSFAEKKIFIAFEDSPKFSQLIRDKLREHGLKISDTPVGADVTYKITGTYSVTGRGKKQYSGSMGGLLEASRTVSTSDLQPEYKKDRSIAGPLTTAAIFPSLARTEIGVWLAQTIGLTGFLNEMTFGDTRGWCFTTDCDKYTSFGAIVVSGAGGDHYWWLQGSVVSDKVELNAVVPDLIEQVLRPWLEIKPAPG